MKKKNFRSVEITSRKLVETFHSGIHSSPLKDSLIDVDAVRDYQVGDKKLDSKSSLRSGRIMSRSFDPERALSIFLVLDVSQSQYYGSEKYLKIEAGIITSLYLNFLAVNSNDKVGMVAFDNKVRSFVEPTEDEKEIVALLENIWNKGNNNSEECTNLEIALQEIFRLEPSNSLIFLISDFCFPVDKPNINAMKRLSSGKNNCLISIVLINKQNNKIPPFKARIKDAETNQEMVWNFTSNAAAWEQNVKNNLYKGMSKVVFLDVSKKNFIMPLVRYFLVKG